MNNPSAGIICTTRMVTMNDFRPRKRNLLSARAAMNANRIATAIVIPVTAREIFTAS
jgi:hypothetical protein